MIIKLMDCFATLAMTDSAEIALTSSTNHRHCKERSDEAIHESKTSIVHRQQAEDAK
jgi:hypothetical protein